MIPIFRKIHKQLAEEYKPFKNMRYAVGEIVLVVIGILIALQINNWNKARKNGIDERMILEHLLYTDTVDARFFCQTCQRHILWK